MKNDTTARWWKDAQAAKRAATTRPALPRLTPEQRAARYVQLQEARLLTLEKLQRLLPSCHPHDVASIEQMIHSIAAGERWSLGELEAAAYQAEKSSRRSKAPVSAGEADRLRYELQGDRL